VSDARAPGADVQARAAGIGLLVCDVDGVMTDGTVWLDDRGEETKGYSILDGLGLKLLKSSGVEVAIITGRSSGSVAARARELRIEHLVQGASDKLAAWQALLARLSLSPQACAFMGDDLPDLPVMRRCALAITVPSASEVVRAHAHYITRSHAGAGAVREACELIMQAQGTLQAALAPYLE
jgi:3-deoxy-D-manno-octulosonate 8-phosphate phosphatase (KDO 8-P phosphatase)